MNDEQMRPLLKAWFQARTIAPTDVSNGVAQVLANVSRTRQRGRWWPLTLFDRPALIPATNGRTRPRGFTMSSAIKFIAAAAIVALFGGFLLAGVLTTPQGDEMAPAAVTASPSPMTTDESLSGMVTEEVQPGVLRVVSDGVRDLASVEAVDVVAGDDGSIWLRGEYENLRLGSDGSHPRPLGLGPEDHVFEVATDGTMWAIPNYRYPSWRVGAGFRSTDGEVWTSQPCPGSCYGVTVAPDGTVWASWREEDGRWRAGYLGPTGWQPLGGDLGPLGRFYFTDAGDVYGAGCDWGCWLLRYEDGVWQDDLRGAMNLVDVGPDGTIWEDAGRGSGTWMLVGQEGLARFEEGEWAEWTSAVLPAGSLAFGRDHEFETAPDGSLWSSLWQSADGRDPGRDGVVFEEERLPCDGLVRFDGTTVDHFLPGRCISMDIAADGSVWVLAEKDEGRRDLYVITPEAVTATS